jgi:hypothetical protein
VGDAGLTWARLGASCLTTVGVEGLAGNVNGTIHRPVRLFRDPSSTRQSLHLISILTPYLMNLTSHPASHSLTTEMRDCLVAGMI